MNKSKKNNFMKLLIAKKNISPINSQNLLQGNKA